MEVFAQFITGTGKALLWAVEICMLIRAVLSFLPISEDNPLLGFVAMVTEPVISPIRNLFEDKGWFQDLPLDMSFFAAYMVLMLVSALLTALPF